MSSNDAQEGRAYFTMLVSLPAIFAWIAYGAAWLLGPHFATPPDPLLWAGCVAGGYYLILGALFVGPIIFLGF